MAENGKKVDDVRDADSENLSCEEEANTVKSNDLLVEKFTCFICSTKGLGDTMFQSYPCGCNFYCKKCAMKVGTGGRCKTCKQIYSSMKSVLD